MPFRLSRSARRELLVGVWLFSQCTTKELDRLAAITTPTSAEQGRVLAREGETGEAFFVIVSGSATATIGGIQVGLLGPGLFFGEMALLDGGPRVATVTAQSPMDLLVLSRSDFDALLKEIPSVGRRMLMAVGGRLRIADKELVRLRQSPVSGL